MEKQIATLKKNLVKHFTYVLEESVEQEAFINEFFKEYVHKGTPNFQKVLVVFGEEEKVAFESLGVVEKQVYGFSIPESILGFSEKKNSKNYQQLVAAFYRESLVQILASKNKQFIAGILHTDIAMSTIFTAAYFPEKAKLAGAHLLNFLKAHKERFQIYPPDLEFGYGSIVFLAAHLLEQLGEKELASGIKNFIKNRVPAYESAIADLYSTDEKKVNAWVDGLAKFHLENSKDDLTLPFNHEYWQFFAIEVISLLKLRSQKGLSNDFIKNPLLVDYIPFIKESVSVDEETKLLESRVV
jgi:hypothetical protein